MPREVWGTASCLPSMDVDGYHYCFDIIPCDSVVSWDMDIIKPPQGYNSNPEECIPHTSMHVLFKPIWKLSRVTLP